MRTYSAPKDLRESRRLDLQHDVLARGLGRNVFAPIIAPHAILDAACGTGLWVREVAAEFKQARPRVVGFDKDLQPLKAIQAELGRKGGIPKGVRFEAVDALGSLPYPDGAFDYVHSRHVAFFLLQSDWPRYIGELCRVCGRDGWVELIESEVPRSAGPHMTVLRDTIVATQRREFGYDNIGLEVPGMLSEAGLTNVFETSTLLGEGATSHLQADIFEVLRRGITNFARNFIMLGLFTREEINEHLAALEAEKSLPITWPIYIAYGQKR